MVAAIGVLVGGAARAGMLGTTPFSVACGTLVTVDTVTSGKTLTLDATDPILAVSCPGNGITIRNKGSGSSDRFFTIDCGTNQATPIEGSGAVGIMLDGSNLSALNCYVQGFSVGVQANGDGTDVEDSQVVNATGDGFRIKSRVKIT